MDRKTSLLLVIVLLLVAGGIAWYFSATPPGEDSRPVSSQPDPWAEYAQSELKKIQSAQEDLDRYIGADPVLKRYRALRNRLRGTKWEARASRQEASFRTVLNRAAEEELDRIQTAEKPLREKKAEAEILTLYGTFPPQFLRITPAGEVISDGIRTLRARIRDRFIGDRKLLEAHLKAWELDSAREVLARMDDYTSEELRGDFEELRETIEEMELARSLQIRREVADRYFLVDQAIRAAMKKRDERVAIREILRVLEHDWKAGEKPFVFLPSVDYAELIRLVKEESWDMVVQRIEIDPRDPTRMSTALAVLLDLRSSALVALFRKKSQTGLEAAIKKGDGKKFEFQRARGSKGHLIRREDRIWLVVGEDRMIPISGLASFPTVDLVQLGVYGWDEIPSFSDSPWGQMAAGLLFHFSGSAVDFARSRKYLERAKALGMKGVDIYLATLSASQSDRQEHMIRTEISQIDLWIRKHKYEEAWVALDTLLRESNHPLVKESRAELDRKLTEVNSRRTFLQKLSADFRAPVIFTTSGRLQVRYDFSVMKQLEAFGTLEKAGGHPLRGRWKWHEGFLESGAFPSAIQWKVKMKGDLDITYDLTPMEEPQNIVVDLFYKPGGKEHYAVIFGFDWVGRANGDPENEVEDKFGMPRTCVLKYPVDVLLRDWQVPATWARWKERLVGAAVQEVSPARETTHYVRILREGARIQLHVDGKLAWEGEDGEYREGFILFYSDCRARMDNLRIRFDAGE